jgi:hypothetical protein
VEKLLVNKINKMRKILLALLVIVGLSVHAQTTLDKRVELIRSADFNMKLRVGMYNVAVGILTAPLPTDTTLIEDAILKKQFAKGIIQGVGVENYTFSVIASGQVTDTTSDTALLAIIGNVFNEFINFKKQTEK